jgi:hypothetical protein
MIIGRVGVNVEGDGRSLGDGRSWVTAVVGRRPKLGTAVA